MDFSLSRQLASDVLALCRERGLMIATAESCTGGLISAALTSVPGSSDVFDRGFATYSNDAKVEMLGVPMEEIAAHVVERAEEGDVVAVLSNGGFGGLHDLLLEGLAGR